MKKKKLTFILLIAIISIFAFSPFVGLAQDKKTEYDSPYVDKYISEEKMQKVDSIIEVAILPSTTYSVLSIFMLLVLFTGYLTVIGILVMIFVGNK